MITLGKVNIIIDGQFGSTGKGLIAAWFATLHPAEIYVSNLSPNAGHTFPFEGVDVVTKQLPVGGIVNRRATIYLSAGSIIDPEQLAAECKRFNIDKYRLFIHPRAAVISKEDKLEEADLESSVAKIASTQSGTGAALARKIMRSAKLAQDCPELHEIALVNELDLMGILEMKCITVMVETSQGFDLSLVSGLSYPHCTSREITVNSVLSDIQVHPKYLGSVIMSCRAFPIRVGNLMNDNRCVGESGPFYDDSTELSWKELDIVPEKTTNTQRIRRVASFSLEQYRRALHHLQPTSVFLNFANYFRDEDLELYRQILKVRVPDLLGVGTTLGDIYQIKDSAEAMRYFKIITGERSRKSVGLTGRNVHILRIPRKKGYAIF